MTKKKKLKPLQFYKSVKNGRWYWRLVSKNGRKVANCSGGKGSGYGSEAKAKAGYRATRKLILAQEI